jgi:hypothetical protein
VTDPVPSWWADTWKRLETRWLRARRTGTLLIEASEGLGGDELSRRLCTALLCHEETEGPPCGRCTACRLANGGTHPDFQGPNDADTRYGIEDLRAWLARLACCPVVSTRTVLWLPAPDRLGLAAASALLKTLEEPPEDAVLVLSARNSRTLPPTVRSRAEVHRVTFPERAQGLAWLRESLPSSTGRGEVHELFWELAEGAPFLARRYAILVGDRYERLVATVSRFFGTAADALRAAHDLHGGSWADDSKDTPSLAGPDAARLLSHWFRAALNERCGLNQESLPPVLAGPLRTMPTRRLLELHDAARKLVRLSGRGINEALAWEALALSCVHPGSDAEGTRA